MIIVRLSNTKQFSELAKDSMLLFYDELIWLNLILQFINEIRSIQKNLRKGFSFSSRFIRVWWTFEISQTSFNMKFEILSKCRRRWNIKEMRKVQRFSGYYYDIKIRNFPTIASMRWCTVLQRKKVEVFFFRDNTKKNESVKKRARRRRWDGGRRRRRRR